MYFTSIGTSISKKTSDSEQIRAAETAISDDKSKISGDRAASIIDRIHSRNRMTADERVKALCDEKPWLLREYAGFDMPAEGRNKPYRLGVICALATVCSRKAVIVANDNTITAGAWWPGTPEKIEHALDLALRLQIPVIYLIECAGLYLPRQDKTFAGPTGAGAIFEKQAQLNRAGILQIAAIFGDCIAGGGYMPLMCDKIVMTEQATICIGGTAITSQTTGNQQQTIGDPAVHVHQSGCADCRVPDDRAAIDKLRRWMNQMPTPACDFFRIDEPIDSPFDIRDLYALIPADPSVPFDIEQVLARLADGAQIQYLYDECGPEVIAAFALVDGLPAVFIANRSQTTQSLDGQYHAGGILYRDAIVKMRKIVENARQDGIPIIWIQDVSGFDVGPEAEREGLLRYGAMLLRELAADSLAEPAHMTILLRKASGAGYYAMKGAPFHPALTVATALTKLEVMSPQTLAGSMYDRKLANTPQDTPEHKQILEAKQKTIHAQMHASSPQMAAIRGDIDDIVNLDELRRITMTFLQAAWQNGSRPVKPRRLWSLLNTL